MMKSDQDPQIREALNQLDVPDYPVNFFGDLAEQLEQTRSVVDTRSHRLLWPLSVAAVAILVVGGALVSNNSSNSDQFKPTLASQILAKSYARISTVNSVSGTVESKSNINGTESSITEAFRMRSDGSYWIKPTTPEKPGIVELAYNAQAGTYEGVGYGTDPGTLGSEAKRALDRVGEMIGSDLGTPSVPVAPDTSLESYKYTGLFGAAPDYQYSGGDVAFLSSVAQSVDTLRDTPNTTFVGATFEGRSVWNITLPLTTSDDVQTATTIIVDQKSFFPVQLHSESSSIYQGQKFTVMDDVTVHDLVVNPKVSDESFTVSYPSKVKIDKQDFGARNVSLGKVKSVVGYAPAAPLSLPAGFRLSTVTVATKANATTSSDANHQPLDSDSNVVSSVYTNGIRSLVITTRDAGPAGTQWADPLSNMSIDPSSISSDSTLTSGVFKATVAHVQQLTDTTAAPHLWGQTDKLVFTVQGNVSKTELLQVANSLQQK